MLLLMMISGGGMMNIRQPNRLLKCIIGINLLNIKLLEQLLQLLLPHHKTVFISPHFRIQIVQLLTLQPSLFSAECDLFPELSHLWRLDTARWKRRHTVVNCRLGRRRIKLPLKVALETRQHLLLALDGLFECEQFRAHLCEVLYFV